MKVQVMCNGWNCNMHHQGMPGEFRDLMNCNTRFDIEIQDPVIEQAIKAGLEAGFKPEIWIEKIVEESCQ